MIRFGAVAFLLALAAGLAIMIVAAFAWGDWWLIRLPWGDIGMQLIVIGLGGSLVLLFAENLIEPVGRWRLLALPGILLGGLVWSFMAFLGLPVGGACCEQPTTNLATALYSAPQAILILIAAVAVTAMPLVLTRPWAGRTR